MSDDVILTREELAYLQTVDTPTVCNVIELFDVRPRNVGYMNERIKCCFPQLGAMVGYATTATFRSDAPPRGSDVYGSIDAQLQAFASIPAPPVIVFQDVDDPPKAATFGEVMCSTYKAFGAAGLITSGAARDLDQVEAIGFKCFAASAIASHGYCHILHINLPVSVGGMTIYPGDLLHGDRNGVTTIPRNISRLVVQGCKDLIAAEEEVLHYVKTTAKPTIEEFVARRKRLVARFKEISESLKQQMKG